MTYSPYKFHWKKHPGKILYLKGTKLNSDYKTVSQTSHSIFCNSNRLSWYGSSCCLVAESQIYDFLFFSSFLQALSWELDFRILGPHIWICNMKPYTFDMLCNFALLSFWSFPLYVQQETMKGDIENTICNW